MPQEVPESFREPLELLGKFTPEQTERALTDLASQPYIRTRMSVRDALFRAFPDRKLRPALRELSAMLMAFARVSYTQGDEAQETFENLSAGTNLNLTDDQRTDVRDRLLAFVAIPGLVLAARAAHMERNHERLLTSSSIETDLRPLMDDDGKTALVIPWHTLNLRYTSGQFDEDQSESIVLDHEDLVSLQKQIEAALDTQLRVQSDMETRNIRVWDPYTSKAQTQLPEEKS